MSTALAASNAASLRGAAVAPLRVRARAHRAVASTTRASAGARDDAPVVLSASRVTVGDDARALLPPASGARANLVAVVAAKPPPAPAQPEVSPFVAFCRANWGYFAALQTVALIGASYNGRLARKRRLEIAEINAKLRAMMAKYESRADSPDASEDEDASRAIAEGKAALTAGNYAAARAAFEEGKAAAKAAGDDVAGLSAAKGAARAMMESGDLRGAIAELEGAVDAAVAQGDSSVYGMLGDCHTDLAELVKAGAYYDKCLEMD